MSKVGASLTSRGKLFHVLGERLLLVSQFHFVYRYCGTTVQHCGMHCYLVSMAILAHVMSTMSSIYVGNLAWHLLYVSILFPVPVVSKTKQVCYEIY